MPKTNKTTDLLPLIPHEFKNGETISITPALAETILTNLNYAHQRLIRVKHVNVLATQMENQEFTHGTQISFGQLPDGSLHLVNGQHRLKAVICSEIPIAFQILITPCKDQQELNTLWRRNDRLVVPRNISDILHSEEILAQYNLRVNVAEAIYKAILIINANFRQVSRHADPYLMRSDEARLKLATDWWESGVLFQNATSTAPSKVKRVIYQGGVTAVGLVTFRYQPETAYNFWYGLSENDGLAKDDPRAQYNKYIYNKDRAKVMGQIENSKASSHAWNHFFQKETMLKFQIPDRVKIEGTPYDTLLAALFDID